MQAEIIASRPGSRSRASSQSNVLVAGIFAAVLGAFLIWGVGFSQIEVVHNAAHDMRHSSGFPCH